MNAQDKTDEAEVTLPEDFAEAVCELGPAAQKTGARTLKVSLAPNQPAFYRLK